MSEKKLSEKLKDRLAYRMVDGSRILTLNDQALVDDAKALEDGAPAAPEHYPQLYFPPVEAFGIVTIEELNNRPITEEERERAAKSVDTYNRLKSKP